MKEYGLDEGDYCKKNSASHEIRTELKKWTLSVVKVHSSRESIPGPYEKVLMMLMRGTESHMDLACELLSCS